MEATPNLGFYCPSELREMGVHSPLMITFRRDVWIPGPEKDIPSCKTNKKLLKLKGAEKDFIITTLQSNALRKERKL